MQYKTKSGIIVKIIGDHNEPYFIDKVQKGSHAYKVVQEINNPDNKFLVPPNELKEVKLMEMKEMWITKCPKCQEEGSSDYDYRNSEEIRYCPKCGTEMKSCIKQLK